MGHKSNETKEFRNTIIASQGDYKLRGDSDPFTFLFACMHTYSCGRTFHIHWSLVY